MPEVVLRSHGAFRNEIQIDKHSLIADEPESAGGTDQGPNPYDLLAAALGACTSMTLTFYAKREKFPLEGAEVRVSHSRSHAKDCADCLTQEGYVHNFDVTIKLEGPLTPEQKQKLLEVARRCPVRKTLTSQIRVTESLKED